MNDDTTNIVPSYETPPWPPKRSGPSLWHKLFIEYNPFYLASAACMLGGCLALTNSLSWSPIALRRLITLIVTLNVYEAALLAIALFLVKRRRQNRDGRMLLLLQAFFLVDFTFLNAEIANVRSWGVAVNAILLVLAVIKLAVVLVVLKPRFTPVQFGFVVFQMLVLFGVPCVLKWMDGTNGAVNSRHLYALWWLLALLPVLYEALALIDPHRQSPSGVVPMSQVAPTGTYIGLPYVSLLVHVCILHYVYDARFYGAHCGPLLLGLAVVFGRLAARHDLVAFRALLPIAAVLVSLNNPFSFLVSRGYPQLEITPVNLMLAATFLVYVWSFWRRQALILLPAGAAVGAFYVFGPSKMQMARAWDSTWTWTVRILDKARPQSLADWGWIGLVASFAFLAIGFWVSLRKAAPPVDET